MKLNKILLVLFTIILCNCISGAACASDLGGYAGSNYHDPCLSSRIIAQTHFNERIRWQIIFKRNRKKNKIDIAYMYLVAMEKPSYIQRNSKRNS